MQPASQPAVGLNVRGSSQSACAHAAALTARIERVAQKVIEWVLEMKSLRGNEAKRLPDVPVLCKIRFSACFQQYRLHTRTGMGNLQHSKSREAIFDI